MIKSKNEMQKKLKKTKNKKINVYHKVDIENELGKDDKEDAVLKNIWADIVPQTGKLQNQQGDTLLSNVTHKINVNYHAGKDIKNDMYIEYRGKRFDIEYILNPRFEDEDLEIFAREVIE